MNIIEIADKPIYIVADIHGNFDVFENGVKNNDLKDCVIIVAGDCGFGFYKENYYKRICSSMNNHFIERNVHCFMIRGNHDDPSYFDNERINYSNIKAISDYTILNIGKYNILCVGGALSIDRTMRINNHLKRVEDYAMIMEVPLEEAKNKILPWYWDNEAPIYDEKKLNEIKENDININIVVTHTSPSFAFKTDKGGVLTYWLQHDETLDNDLSNERKVLSLLYEKLLSDNHPIEKWIYGHFHEHCVEVIDNIEFTALINCDYNFDVKELNVY